MLLQQVSVLVMGVLIRTLDLVLLLMVVLLLQANKIRMGLRLGAQVQGRRVRNLEAFARSPCYPLTAQLARFFGTAQPLRHRQGRL